MAWLVRVKHSCCDCCGHRLSVSIVGIVLPQTQGGTTCSQRSGPDLLQLGSSMTQLSQKPLPTPHSDLYHGIKDIL